MKTLLITCFAILTLSALAACADDTRTATTTSSEQSAMVDSKDMHTRPANQ